jgi:hypothetical protein
MSRMLDRTPPGIQTESMTRKLDSDAVGTERAVMRSYLREFGLGMVAYAVVLAAVLIWGGLDGSSPWRFVWAMLPVLPTLWIAVAVVRHIRRIDDYQRLLLLQGLGVGFLVAMAASVTVGFLDIAGLNVPMPGWIVYAVGMLGWLVAAQVAKRR